MNYVCDFCRDLQKLKEIDARSNTDTAHEYTMILLRRAWNMKVGRAHAGEKQYRAKAIGYELNYCPECGRRIRNNGER